MTKVRNALALMVLAALGVVAVGSGLIEVDRSPSQRVHKPKRSQPPPAPKDDEQHVHVKLVMVIDGDPGNSSPERVTIQYSVDGVKYPPGDGAHFPTDRYWFRVLKVKRGTRLDIGATNKVPDQAVDVFIYRVNPDGDGRRVLCHGEVRGMGGAYCVTTAR